LYTQVSEKHILPGVDLVEQLGFAYENGSTQERTMALRKAELDAYQDEALKSIQKVANSVSYGCKTQNASLLNTRTEKRSCPETYRCKTESFARDSGYAATSPGCRVDQESRGRRNERYNEPVQSRKHLRR
jgi:hypothetical protein